MKQDLDRLIREINSIANKHGETIYEICFRNAGVGFCMWSEAKASKGCVDECGGMNEGWKKGLYMEFYRPTIYRAAIDTLAFLKKKYEGRGGTEKWPNKK